MNALKLIQLLLFLGCNAWAQSPIEIVGSGDRGLVFSEGWSGMPPYTVILALDPRPPLGEGTPGYVPGRTPELFKSVIPPEELKRIPTNWWSGSQFNVFSFDSHSVFSHGSLLRIEAGRIRIFPEEAQRTAREEFGFSDSELYLGIVGRCRFFWKEGHPREVYFYNIDDHPRVVRRFKLKWAVTEPLGMAKGNPSGDLALQATAIPKGWSVSPRIIEWIVLNFKDAKPVK